MRTDASSAHVSDGGLSPWPYRWTAIGLLFAIPTLAAVPLTGIPVWLLAAITVGIVLGVHEVFVLQRGIRGAARVEGKG